MRDRILQYMAQGVKASQVASIVGCTPSYIAQLAKDENFLKDLAEARNVKQESEVDEDKILSNKYLALEHRVLDAIDSAMSMAELPALTRALEVIATRQEKRQLRLVMPNRGEGTSVVVNLVLPQHAVPEYQVNSQREVVSINNRTIAPMSSEGVSSLFKALQMKKQEEQAKILTPGTDF